MLFTAHGPNGWSPLSLSLLGLLVFSPDSGYAAKRCDWHAPKAVSGETVYRKCLDLASLEGKTIDLPKNVTRIAVDGFSICPNAFRTEVGGEADILYLLDNSGSMWTGDNDFKTCAGDPFEKRDDVLSQAVHLQSQLSQKASAGFIPFNSERRLQDQFIVEPTDISPSSPQSAAHIKTLTDAITRSVADQHKNNPNDPCSQYRDELLKSAAVEKVAATFWTQPLEMAIDWRKTKEPYASSSRPAIILVSDGAISDWDHVKSLIPQLPPVYGIHMGYRLNANRQPDLASAQLDTLARLTGGKFYRVSPNDTLTMYKVMEEIIRSVVTSPLPRSLKATNTSLTPPQIGLGKILKSNPDSSLGVTLDSIIALREGANSVDIQLELSDATTRNFNLKFNVAGSDASKNADAYTCYDPPTLEFLGADGKPPALYAGDISSYTVHLTRSPSDLTGVTVIGTSADSSRANAKNWGDREALALGNPSTATGIPDHRKAFPFSGRSDAPRPGNGILESDQAGSVTLTWSHPRDPRETVTYTLPGKIIPILDPVGELKPPDEPARGPTRLDGPLPQSPVLIVSQAPKTEGEAPGACVSGCDILKDKGITAGQIPTWTLPVNAPFTYEYQVFDNVGQFLAAGGGEFTMAQYESVRTLGDTAKVALSLLPVTKQGQLLATGAYIMRLEVKTQGDLVTRNAAGDEVKVRSTRVTQTRRFGFIRQGTKSSGTL